MGTRDIEKLLTDLKNLPKENAPKDFEEKLLQKIYNYERSFSSGEIKAHKKVRVYLSPIFVPAFTIVLVAVLIAYTVSQNDTITQVDYSSIEKATPVVHEQPTQMNEPQKISVPKRKDFVVKRDRVKLNFGPGVSLDEQDYSYNPTETNQPSFINFPSPNEPITIRIPPPEVIFREEFERIGIPTNNRDSIRLINNRRK